MARKSKKKKPINPYDVLAEKIPMTARDLILMIHRVNPTKERVGSKETSERYRLKAELQSLLIRRFGDRLVVEQPNPNQPELFGIRLRHFDEDACHAVIHELDEDARSWAQRQIDEMQFDRPATFPESPTPDMSSPPRELEQVEESLSIPELLVRGKEALEAYDYERTEAFYRRALDLSKDDIQPALALLEILIDHLGDYEKALALAESFSPSTMKQKRVRIWLATASARLNRIDIALELISRILEPEAAEVYCLAANHFIEQQDEKQASDQLVAFKSCGSTELMLETDRLEKEILKLKTRRLAPLEDEMILNWREGATEKAHALANRLLSQIPGNKTARRILNEIEKGERRSNIENLLRLAEEAGVQKNFIRKVDLLSQAMGLGENTPILRKQLSAAQRKARRQLEKAEIDAIVTLWSGGQRQKSLVSYAELETRRRQMVRDRIREPHFTWMEQALCASVTLKPKKLAEAVFALGECADALETEADPQQIIAQLRLHQKLLQSVPKARDALQQAEMRLRNLQKARVKKLLEEADACLVANDLEMTEEWIGRIKAAHLDESDRQRFDEISAKVRKMLKIQIIKSKYAESSNRGDHIACRRIAGRLARTVKDGNRELWVNKVAEHSAAIRKDWSLTKADLRGLPGCYGALGLNAHGENDCCLLLPEGGHVITASAHGRWVFLRTFCLDDQRFETGYILRTPCNMVFPQVTADGNSVWINDSNGYVVQVGLDPFDILYWQDFSDFIADEEVCEEALLYPGSRCLWLNKRDLKKRREDIFEIIHIDQRRITRRIRSPGMASRINTGGELRTALQDFLTRRVRIFSETGKEVDTITFETRGRFDHAAIHPNGVDFIFLPFDDSGSMETFIDLGQQGDLMLTLEVRPDSKKKNHPQKIYQSNGEMVHMIATSLDVGIVFTYFYNDTEENPGYRLAAWKDSEAGLKMIYRVPAPSRNFALAGDESARKVAAVEISDKAFKARLLDGKPIEFGSSGHTSDDEIGIPFFYTSWMCASPTGFLKAESLALMLSFKDSDVPAQLRVIREMKKTASPDEIAALVYAMEQMFRMEEVTDLKIWMRENCPDHYRVKIDLATEAFEKSDWRRVPDLLERISRTGLDGGSARHMCHLLGMSYFADGDVEKALGAWKEGLTYTDGNCELGKFVDYARIALKPPHWRRKHKDRSPIAKTLSILERIDQHMGDKEWASAITVIESEYPLSRVDQQLLARLAEAYLHMSYTVGEMRWVCKVVALAHYLERFEDSFQDKLILPPCIDEWPESRLAHVALMAKQWLANASGF